MRQNLTVSLDPELIRKLRVIAAERSTSVNRLVGEELERIVEQAESFESARRQALAMLDARLHLGGQPVDREALHERTRDRLPRDTPLP